MTQKPKRFVILANWFDQEECTCVDQDQEKFPCWGWGGGGEVDSDGYLSLPGQGFEANFIKCKFKEI